MSEGPKCSQCRKRPQALNYKLCDECREKHRLKVAKYRAKKKQQSHARTAPASKRAKTTNSGSGYTTCLADAPYASGDEEDEDYEDEEDEDEDGEAKEEVRQMLAKPGKKLWWVQEKYESYFMLPHLPWSNKNPYMEFYLKCLTTWANCHDLLSRATFFDVLLKIDPEAKFDHGKKQVESMKMSKALNVCLFQKFKFDDFPKITRVYGASPIDPEWVYIDLEFVGPQKQVYTFCKMKTMYWLVNQYRHEDNDLDTMLDEYVAAKQ
jgi:hypothetical protein